MSSYLQKSNGGAGEFLLLNEELSDVTIIVKDPGHDSWRFPVHSLLLSAQSMVFRRMLSSDFAEKTSRQIAIEDIKPLTVERLLIYIYCGRAEIENWKEAVELLHAAHKYQIDPLVQHCGRFLEHVITISNVCYLFNEAATYSLMTLKEKCLRLILDAGFIVLRRKSFEILSKESIMEIVTNPNLNVDSELTVFEALLNWAPMVCCCTAHQITEKNILQELQPFMPFVCFDDMSDTDKSDLPAAILSCVKPNNRNRIAYCIPNSLLPHAQQLSFQVNRGSSEIIRESLTCIRFSLDASLYLIGLKFVIITTEFPPHFPLIIHKRHLGNSAILYTLNLSTATWKEGLQIHEHGPKQYEAQIILRQPFLLDAKAVYEFETMDVAQNAHCLKTQIQKRILLTSSGNVNISLHSESTWGVTGLLLL